MFTTVMVETYSQCVPWKWAVDDMPSLFFFGSENFIQKKMDLASLINLWLMFFIWQRTVINNIYCKLFGLPDLGLVADTLARVNILS